MAGPWSQTSTFLPSGNRDKICDGWRGLPMVWLSSGQGLSVLCCKNNCISSLEEVRARLPFLPHPASTLNCLHRLTLSGPTATWHPGHFRFMLNEMKHFFLPILSPHWAITGSCTGSLPLIPFLGSVPCGTCQETLIGCPPCPALGSKADV